MSTPPGRRPRFDPPAHLRGVALPSGTDVAALRERYGTERGGRAMLLLGVFLLVPFVVWVVWAGLQQADQGVRWQNVAFEDASDTSVQIRFDVFLPDGADVTCRVRALDVDGVEVGRADVPVSAAGTSTSVVYALPVTARPSSAFVETCRLTE